MRAVGSWHSPPNQWYHTQRIIVSRKPLTGPLVKILSWGRSLKETRDYYILVMEARKYVDNYKEHRCPYFVNPNSRCNKSVYSCPKLHVLPREEGIHCRYFAYGHCNYTAEQCPYLHSTLPAFHDQSLAGFFEQSTASVLRNLRNKAVHTHQNNHV